MQLRRPIVLFCATGGGIGYLPKAPGTFGSLVGLLPCWALSHLDTVSAAAVALLFIGAACWAAHAAEAYLEKKDSRHIVIDEIAGMMITLLGLPFNAMTAAFGFLIFRFLDILKPFPIRLAEQKLPGGIGVVFDDVGAGILGNLMLRLALWVTVAL
jgi:phosphatidylglycerophosphatase A